MLLSRRRLLIDGLKVTAFVPACALLRRPSSAARDERALVVVQLTGGNDGLNTVVPHRQDAYFRLRPTLALKPSHLHALDPDHGLHPALQELAPLFGAGRLTVVHGVGYPEPDRSHSRSLEIWHCGGPEQGRAGWVGRMADQIVAVSPGAMPALHVGDEDLPRALVGEDVFATSMSDESSLRLSPLPGLDEERTTLLRDEPRASPELAFLRSAARGAYDAARRLETALSRPGGGGYPDLPLARKLRLVARLVTGGFDTRLFFVTLGGFDTHARQAGLHAARLEELARSLGAFERDLASTGAAGRVMTLVFSEFGRRAEENASRGTDHGAAAPVFLIGAPGRGGLLGTPPDLGRLEDGDVGYTTDFRAVYATIEGDWMGLTPSSAVQALDLDR